MNPKYVKKHLYKVINPNSSESLKQDSAWRIVSHLDSLEFFSGQQNWERLDRWGRGQKFTLGELSSIVQISRNWLDREAIASVASAIQEGEREVIGDHD